MLFSRQTLRRYEFKAKITLSDHSSSWLTIAPINQLIKYLVYSLIILILFRYFSGEFNTGNGRLSLDASNLTSTGIAYLKIHSLAVSDEGMYKCDVTYVHGKCPSLTYTKLFTLGEWANVLYWTLLLLLPGYDCVQGDGYCVSILFSPTYK